MKEHRLKITNMSKPFPKVETLDNIKFTVGPGSAHALTSEDGADKSTSMKCSFDLYYPDSNIIGVNDRVMDIEDPDDVLRNGISMVHQELNPVPYRNVIDNIQAGRFQIKGIVMDENQMMEKTRSLPRDLDSDMDVTTSAKSPSVSRMQAVETAKAVSYSAKIIIMDESAPSLTVAETQHPFKITNKLRKKGRSTIYISRKLKEIFETTDEIIVMRGGQYIGTQDIEDIIIDQLMGQTVGKKMNERFSLYEDVRTDEVMLQVKNFTGADPRSFKDASLDPHKGGILGIGGLVGAQRTELTEAMFGLRRIVNRELTVNGKIVVNRSPQNAIRNDFALLIEKRRATGIIPILSVWDNALTVAYKKLTGNAFGYIHTKKLFPSVDKMCTDLGVRTARTETLIKNLLGGNRWRALVGGQLLANCDVITLDESTRGVDMGAKYRIYRIMQDLVKKRETIITVSSEMPELLGMSDRIIVTYAGKQTGIPGETEATQAEVMKYATQFEDEIKEGMSVRK